MRREVEFDARESLDRCEAFRGRQFELDTMLIHGKLSY